jgi:hypothetical protein
MNRQITSSTSLPFTAMFVSNCSMPSVYLSRLKVGRPVYSNEIATVQSDVTIAADSEY